MQVSAQEVGALGFAAVVVNNVLRFALQLYTKRAESQNGVGQAQRERDANLRRIAENTAAMSAKLDRLDRANDDGKLSCSWTADARGYQTKLLEQVVEELRALRRAS